MTTRTLPKKITELGRIRIGDQEPNSGGKGTHPHKLDAFRLTSPNKPLLHFAANLYGGEVRPWVGPRAPDGQFELYTTVNSMDVLVPTLSAVDVKYEEWIGSGCVRRCTGDVITHCPGQEARVGQPCTCPEDEAERSALAKEGKACARICRLNVILPDLPGVGTWRLQTTGYYATAELLGSLELLQMAQHQIIEAALRLEQRTVKRLVSQGQGKPPKATTMKFAVPVLWPKYTPRQMLAAADSRVLLMAPPEKTVPQLPAASAIADLYGDDRETVIEAHYTATAQAPETTTSPQTTTSQDDEPHEPAQRTTADPDAKPPLSPTAGESLRRYRMLYQQYKRLSPAILDTIPRQLWDCSWLEISATQDRLERIAADYPLVAYLLQMGAAEPRDDAWPEDMAEARKDFPALYAAVRAEVQAYAQNLASDHRLYAVAQTLVRTPWAPLAELQDFLTALAEEAVQA